jgi:hypothetical protein
VKGKVSLPPVSEERVPPSFGRVLGGSAIGATAGAGVGLLLVKAGSEADPDGDPNPGVQPESEAAATIIAAGLAAFVVGGPIGAVEIGGIEERRRDAYVMAGFGELMVGALGIALAGQLHDSPTARLAGLGTGMVLGAAGGAYLVASKEEQDGLFSYRKGQWRTSVPDMRILLHSTIARSPSVGVTVVSARL